jgi:hypothetical protein
MPVSDKLFNIDFGSSAGDEINSQREKTFFSGAYLSAIALAEIGWLWLIARTVTYFIRLILY